MAILRVADTLSTFQSIPHLVTNDTPVKQVTQIKILGVYIDHNLSWNIHIKD